MKYKSRKRFQARGIIQIGGRLQKVVSEAARKAQNAAPTFKIAAADVAKFIKSGEQIATDQKHAASLQSTNWKKVGLIATGTLGVGALGLLLYKGIKG